MDSQMNSGTDSQMDSQMSWGMDTESTAGMDLCKGFRASEKPFAAVTYSCLIKARFRCIFRFPLRSRKHARESVTKPIPKSKSHAHMTSLGFETTGGYNLPKR